MFDFFNFVGFIGTALYFLSYFMLNAGKFDDKPARYILINMLAACCVIVSLIEHFNAPSFVIQVGWIGLSIYGLIRLKKKSQQD